MYNFIVLGLIPGTDIQITFQMWLNAAGLIVALIALAWLYNQHRQPLPALKISYNGLHQILQGHLALRHN
ncbi:MAG TPA: hypothetical protein VLG37_00350 [Candidatus Saccharimonadales bacterium]|nr:hypothetical protein [Candidatus Saccharimonadales bacterium]